MVGCIFTFGVASSRLLCRSRPEERISQQNTVGFVRQRGRIVADGDVDRPPIPLVCPDDRVVAHRLVLLVGRFIRRGEEVRLVTRVSVGLVRLIGYLEMGWQILGGTMPGDLLRG